ncbi:three-Cys-motif partner protein TcmP [Bradyrhizobium sp. BR 10261]|uniref:three-Cys-motif partner protein TcmP n=1 Tax=Bradyrhizobium sp. BR 10261 TaxID=2749992 RepID=UPI001C64636B|nr:three-Cys-motif partner protein TcmP [Bradyrhizobium sp. BR 10261]MBW7962846.1 three-Cys-motif partner protein TcmP [Bradyrhizobium sp. BR 10261]
MAKKEVKLDPDDGMIIGEVGPWAVEKHDRVKRYIQAARGARAKFLPPKGSGGATYIELYSGAGRSLISGTSQIIDGSAVVAFNAGRASGHPFSEMHLSDLDAQNSAALAQRIKYLGGSATSYVGEASVIVDQVMGAINPYGLHLAFLDPFNLAQLPFSIIERMLRVKRMDMIIHVSLQDLQRNLDRHSRVGGALDIFAPGWRDAVNVNQATHALRAAFIDYWLQSIRSLGTHPATGIPLIVGSKSQRLYWLVFLSSNPLGHKLWNDVQNLGGQGSLLEGL